MAIELLQFQQDAASQIADRYMEYIADPIGFGRGANRRNVPFYQALSSITGSGKTAILAQAVNEITALSEVPPIILWLSKGKVVVQQSYANLARGGKYNHLLGDISVRLLSEYDPDEVANISSPLLYFATVGTFNQKDRESSNLRIFSVDTDNIEATRWEALKNRETGDGIQRPLIIVYDEAQNLSDQQTTLLLELKPAAVLLASATLRFPAQFNTEVIEPLKAQGDYKDNDLITSVNIPTVVSSGLIKGTVSLSGVNAPMEETVSEMLSDMRDAEDDAQAEALSFSPKAIYVCNTNIVSDDASITDSAQQKFEDRRAPPILIWRYLVEQHNIPPSDIAVYANLKTHQDFPLPDDFILFNGGEKDYDGFINTDCHHIIFNQTLQEGWDDPDVYFAYVDKTMESTVQISQVIGRVLRQPNATHYSSDRLNTAHFYVRVDRKETFGEVVENVQKGLGGKGPNVRISTASPGKARPTSIPAKMQLSVPRTAIDNSPTVAPVDRVISKIHDYSNDQTNTLGAGRRRVVSQRIGEEDSEDSEWQNFEQSNRVSARWVFHRTVARRYRPSLTVMNTEDQKFDARVGVGSNAFASLTDSGCEAVDEYLRYAVVKQLKPKPYALGGTVVNTDEMVCFQNSVHEGYDGLNGIELEFAAAIDKTGRNWARNRSQTGYKIPLVTLGDTVWFFPDFLVWKDASVICVDTKGEHLVEEAARRKLLSILPHKDVTTTVHVKFVVKGTWRPDGTPDSKDGFSLLELGSGRDLRRIPFDDMDALASAIASETD